MTTATAGAAPAPAAPGNGHARAGRGSVLDLPWVRFAVRRAGGLVLALALLVTVTFLIVPLLPGDPARAIAGSAATPQAVATIRADLGLDRPLPQRFVEYVGGLARGDLGTSFRYRVPVADVVATRLPYTVQLAVPAIVLVLALAVPLGMAVGVLTRGGRRRRLDVAFGVVAGAVAAVPPYVLGTLLVVTLAIGLKLFPPGGAQTPASLVLPILALSLGPACAVARVVRAETSSVLEQEFLRTARARRLPAGRLYLRHALPNLLTSVLTLTGLVLTSLLGGTVVIENVFSYPGLGTEIVQAIVSKDYPVIQGIILCVGVLALLVNLLVDVVLGLVDPRTLTGGHHGG
ncbi:ABC transporter permease [Kineosporia sp. A_224]|uniref:ABC transporter permease n=1 Tax=Kineosporia sp. A_224 TaxID=1962180 RepID=UPI000B4A8A4D|nr:ABC transporter permease [Kineosporia sp. A_224]